MSGRQWIILIVSAWKKKKLTSESSPIFQQRFSDSVVSLEYISMLIDASSISIYLDAWKKGKVNTAK